MRRASLALVAVVLGATAGSAAEIRSVTDRFDDDIVSIATEGGRTVVKTAKGRSIPLAEVKHIRFDERAPSLAADANVILLNKDEIHGSILGWDTKTDSFKLKTSALGEVSAKIDNVAAIFFNVPPEAERRLQSKYLGWLQAKGFEGRPGPDAVYIRAGGKATGTLNEISQKGIKLDAAQIGVQTFALKDVEAIVCGNAGSGSGAAADTKGTAVRIRCADGSSVSGTIEKFESGKLELRHQLGTLTIPVKEILELFVLNGAFVYLSDLDPIAVDERFPEGLERDKDLYCWKRDKEVCVGGRLRLGGRTYDKGVGVHSYCSLTYKLGGGFKEFRTVIGLDDTTKYLSYPGTGAVTFRVNVGDSKGMKPAKELPEGRKKKRGDAPEELTINVEGYDQIEIVADYGSYMHILGRADWADAHLVKR